jgi:hypothetical protein
MRKGRELRKSPRTSQVQSKQNLASFAVKSSSQARKSPGKYVAADGLEKILALEQDFNRFDHFAASALGDGAFKTGVQRLIGQFLGHLLHGQKQHREFGILARDCAGCLQSIHLRHRQI